MHSQKFVDGLSNENNCDLEKKPRRLNWYVYFCSLTADLLEVTCGFGFSWASPVIPKLKSNNSEINPFATPITTLQISILASVPSIAACIGFLLSGKISDTIGRKKTMIVMSIGFILSFTTIAFAKHIYIYFVCVFINGFCEGVSLATVPVYNTEIAQDKNRGKIGCLLGLSAPVGSLLGYIFGPITSIKIFALIGSICPWLFLLLSSFIPESPIFLSLRERELECLSSLEKLRSLKDVQLEYQKIEIMRQNNRRSKARSIVDIFKNRMFFKTFLLSIELCSIQLASGIFVLRMFMAPIFNEAGSSLSGNTIGIIVGSVQVFFTFTAAFLIDKLGRRPLLLFSCMSCIINLFILGFNFYLKYIGSRFVESITWLPVLSICLLFAGYALGIGPIPFPVMSELFPNEIRATGVGTVLIFNSLLLAVFLFLFPLISELYGIHCCLWILCVCSIIGFIGIFFTVPETKGKSFAEIQNILARNKNI